MVSTAEVYFRGKVAILTIYRVFTQSAVESENFLICRVPGSGAAGGGCVCGRLNGCLLMTYGLLWLSGS